MRATFLRTWWIQAAVALPWVLTATIALAQEETASERANSEKSSVAADTPNTTAEGRDESLGKSAKKPDHLLVLRVSAAMLSAQMNRKIDRQMPISDVVLGTPVTGQARLVGQLEVQPIPSPDKASFNASFKGTVYSQTVGHNGPVTVYGHSITRFTASEEIVFEPGKGFHGGSPKITAQTQCYTDNISANRGGFIGRIIERKAGEQVAVQQPEISAIARDRASRGIAAAFEEQMKDRLVQLNQAVEFQTRLAELRTADGTRHMVARTTPQHLEIADAVTQDQVAVAIPDLVSGTENCCPIEIWVHGSLVPEKVGVALTTVFTNPEQSAVVNALALLPGTLGKETAAALMALVSKQKVAVRTVDEWMVVELNSPVVSKTVAIAGAAARR